MPGLGGVDAAQNARQAQARVDEYKRDELVKCDPAPTPPGRGSEPVLPRRRRARNPIRGCLQGTELRELFHQVQEPFFSKLVIKSFF